MNNAKPGQEVRNLEYWALGLLALAFVGFWPSYFSRLLAGSAGFAFYFHLHAATAILWVALLIVQPLLLRLKQRQWHRFLGKFSYGLVPLLFLSVMLLAHHRIKGDTENAGWRLWIPFKDLFVFAFGFGVAIIYRKNPRVHARGMMVTGMALIEPAMVRVMANVLGVERPLAYYLGILPDYIILLLLIGMERKAVSGRWVFPCALGLFLFVHAVKIFKVAFTPWDAFAQWFISLPLT
jgi:hypothetical protein